MKGKDQGQGRQSDPPEGAYFVGIVVMVHPGGVETLRKKAAEVGEDPDKAVEELVRGGILHATHTEMAWVREVHGLGPSMIVVQDVPVAMARKPGPVLGPN